MNKEFLNLTPENVDRIVDLYVSVFNAPPWNDGWTRAAVAERLGAFAAFPQFRGLAFLVDGEPHALVLGWGERWVRSWIFHINEIGVTPAMQGQGLGSELLSEFEGRLAADGFTGTYLQTGEAVPARTFYEGLGYKRFDRVSLSKKLHAR